MTAEISRRRLLRLLSAAAVALPLSQLPAPRVAASPAPGLDVETATLEAWSDTIIPGEKRSPGDRSVAGASTGPGAVQAGAVDLMRFEAVGLKAVLPALVVTLNAEAARYAAAAGLAPDPTAPPLVALCFEDRTELALELVDSGRPDQLLWFALAAVATLAFHTAGHLDTAEAVRSGHPGLAWIGFPAPDADDLWRYPEFSYGRKLARPHRLTTQSGNPA
jgi:enediyne biosynthesis protein E8